MLLSASIISGSRPLSQGGASLRSSVEIEPPDLSSWREGGTGIPYTLTRTPVDGSGEGGGAEAGVKGPHLLLTAIMHGNEFSGALAACRLLESGFRPLKGRFSVAFLNVAAMEHFRADTPELSRYLDEDMNRVWGELALGGGSSRERVRAREVRALVDSADHVLDLHSTQEEMPPLLLAGMAPKAAELAQDIGCPRWFIRDPGHAAGHRLIEYPRFNNPRTERTALLAECGRHWSRKSPDIALETALRWLMHFGLADDKAAAGVGLDLQPIAQPPCVVEITDVITPRNGSQFRFADNYGGMGICILPEKGTLIATEGRREIRTLYKDCVLLMPTRHPYSGLTAVRLGRIISGAPDL